MEIKDALLDLLRNASDEMGHELSGSLEDVTTYGQERAAHLATIADEPGFMHAVRAERDNVAARAGLDVTGNASAFDARVVGMIQGVLAIGAKTIATA